MSLEPTPEASGRGRRRRRGVGIEPQGQTLLYDANEARGLQLICLLQLVHFE